MILKALLLALLVPLLGCTYHYHLTVNAQPGPPPVDLGSDSIDNPRSLAAPRAEEPSPAPLKGGKPLSIAPGDFQANQSRGGAMVNVLINLNLLKPTSVSTDAAASLQGIPGL